MKQLLTLVLALCLAFSLAAAAEDEAPAWNGFRGLDWGASVADIVALEGENYSETASMDEATGLTGLLYTDGISVSRFDGVYLAYILGDRGLFLAGYSIDSEDAASDFEYLECALTSLYGPASPVTAEELAPLLNGFLPGTHTRSTGWQAGRTGILLDAYDDGVGEILYVGLDFFPDLPDDPEAQPDTRGL